MTTSHLVCPQCFAVNRVPAERLGDTPNCGKCHASLFADHPVELGSDTFDTFVGRNDLPVVVDFWASWCGPCQAMAPHFASAARELRGQVQFAKLSTEDAEDIAARYRIRSIPTLILFQGGQEVDRVSGAMAAPQLLQWLRRPR